MKREKEGWRETTSERKSRGKGRREKERKGEREEKGTCEGRLDRRTSVRIWRASKKSFGSCKE
eukprot:1338407-Amorphochlora_amoeboformis.AAC.1